MATKRLKLNYLSRNARYFNTSLIKSKIDILENYAKKNKLHKLKMDDLFEVFKLSKNEEDYKLSLHLLNIYYNFGRNLNTQQDVNLFFIFILRTKQLNEAKDFLKYFNGWLLCPPSNKYIILCMEEFFSKKKFYDVREIFSFVRQNSQIKLESSFYTITIKSMLMLKNNPIEESMIIYDDSYNMSIYLTNEVHNLLLEHNLFYYHNTREKKLENSRSLEFYEQNIRKIIIRLINELIKNRSSVQLSSKSLSLFAWANIYFDLKEIIKKSNNTFIDVEKCNSWFDIFKLSCLYNQMPQCYSGPFSEAFKNALEDMKNDKDAIKALEYVNIYFNED
ncbi:conserved Plasmodium protein, unknown function [Plasmodium gallinaceum]|uniref:Uncharacterized protein n=1 Tax=Plasmodium gallinaceum TaxID=5849 RepID=A0A1J1GXS6_PLAGA|nr:conserved Plasmodium protein, unknown function [Plasmodium gallinaceum]CRG97364.1 conserved Plasmodium protein, unknown function [Plasmodium gallinaceum]